jgi:signal peptidase II
MLKKQGLVILGIVILDQLVKYIVRSELYIGQTIVILPFFQLTHITNTGVAFGMFQGANLLFAAFTVVVLAGFFFWYYRNKTSLPRWIGVAITLIAAGALGNLVDRVVLGSVVDFLEFHWGNNFFPAFNIADSCITVGGVILFLSLIRLEFRKDKHAPNTL